MRYPDNQGNRKLLMDRSVPGRRGFSLPEHDTPLAKLPDHSLLRSSLPLPEVSEGEIVRYFTSLSQLNFSVDTHFYPLGSCTMKYNPKINDELAGLPGFSEIHPLQPQETVQGVLYVMYHLQAALTEITGMQQTSLAPLAGAHGELAGMIMIRAYHESRGENHRNKVAIPDNAHGTNPASAAMAGFSVVSIPTDDTGNMNLSALESASTDDLAGIMLTLPNTLGIFDTNIVEICQTVRRAGGLIYGDGANMNALLGRTKLGHLGFDICHLNLHKTFSVPHGSGGPGAGPICVNEKLCNFLPTPIVANIDTNDGTKFALIVPPKSIGRIGGFHGNFGALLRAYCYLRSLGSPGLKEISGMAVLNANYLLHLLRNIYALPYDRTCMHEVVLSARNQRARGAKGIDIAKRLLDYGFHAPTMYFPLIVEEALMIEPTESETKDALDTFVEAMLAIDAEIERDPDMVRKAPYTTPVSRLDEARAARRPDLRWRPFVENETI